MDRQVGSWVLRLFVLLLLISSNACKQSPADATSPAAQDKQEKAKLPAEVEAAKPADDKTPNPSDVASNNAAPGVAGNEPKTGKESAKSATAGSQAPNAPNTASSESKTKLAKAYLEIYCAQRKGETEKLLEVYTRHGFEDPKAWTKAWTEAADDHAWVAQITQDAIRTCP